jgi:hypothetical protein
LDVHHPPKVTGFGPVEEGSQIVVLPWGNFLSLGREMAPEHWVTRHVQTSLAGYLIREEK